MGEEKEMSFRFYNERYENPADILYCPVCLKSSEDWETCFFSKTFQAIIGCDCCVICDTDSVCDCPVCGQKDMNPYRDKGSRETLGCDNCIEILSYDDCVNYHKEEML